MSTDKCQDANYNGSPDRWIKSAHIKRRLSRVCSVISVVFTLYMCEPQYDVMGMLCDIWHLQINILMNYVCVGKRYCCHGRVHPS